MIVPSFNVDMQTTGFAISNILCDYRQREHKICLRFKNKCEETEAKLLFAIMGKIIE